MVTHDSCSNLSCLETLVDTCIKFDSEQVVIKKKKIKPKRRLIAAFLCVTLGPFGMHRAYLGTKPHVIAAYTVTLGGGIGLVPVVDLFEIVFSKDMEKFKNNDQFFMWIK